MRRPNQDHRKKVEVQQLRRRILHLRSLQQNHVHLLEGRQGTIHDPQEEAVDEPQNRQHRRHRRPHATR